MAVSNTSEVISRFTPAVGTADVFRNIQEGQQRGLGIQGQQQGLQLGQQELETGRIGLMGTRDQAKLASIVSGAQQMSQLQDAQKLPFLQQRREQLRQSGLPTDDTDDAIALAQAGDFASLDQLTQQAISLGQNLPSSGLTTAQRGQEIQLESRGLDIRSSELEQRREEAAADAGNLSATTQKILDGSQTAAIDAGTKAREFRVLADDIDKLNIGGGVKTTFGETLKDLTGNQDAESDLRKRFLSVRASQVVDNLPPGSASDVDIALALSGFPGERASGRQMVSFLRGLSKVEMANEAFQTFKSRLISEQKSTKGMLTKWKESEEFSGLQDIIQPAQPAFSGALNREITEQDINDTLDANPGVTREQLLQQLQVQ